MTIRKTLLIAFLVVGLVPSILLAYLAYSNAGREMRTEISHGLQVQAATLSESIDRILFERLQNARTWSRLEIMQEIQVKDVDKRLSHFLADLADGYQNVYLELYCTDAAGAQVVASSAASRIGRQEAVAADGVVVEFEGAAVRIGEPGPAGDRPGAALRISAEIPSDFRRGPVGRLQLLFNWDQINEVLDQAAEGGRMLILLDGQSRVIAASLSLREQGWVGRTLAGWVAPGASGGLFVRSGEDFGAREVIVGYDRSDGFQHFKGLGWSTLVIQPSASAFLPVRQIGGVFLALLLLSSALAAIISLLVAGRIARPIVRLIEFTRRFMREKRLPPAPAPQGGEVGELSSTFVQMVQDLEQSRADLVRASKLAVLGEMAAVMAHEVRTPLGIVRSSVQILRREPGLSDEGRELVSFVESETERLNRLVSTLLDSARPRAPRLEPCAMHPLIERCLALLAGQADKKRIRTEAQLDAADDRVMGDEEQLIQVLLNLLLNAIQIVPEAGRVCVATRQEREALKVDVADDGPGIAEADRERVFDPFFTRREGGAGLGLAVVQQIVAAHGGSISAGRSAELGGALFTITLPRQGSEHR